MGKKNLSALMSGIMGNPDPDEESVNTPLSPSQPKPTKQEGKRGPGRPKFKEFGVRATFIVDPELLRKIKYISLVDGITQKEIVDTALRKYIANWEGKTGKINIPEK